MCRRSRNLSRAVALAIAVASCARSEAQESTAAPAITQVRATSSSDVEPSITAIPSPDSLAPPQLDSEFLPLEVPGHGVAIVSPPVAADVPRPIVIALHAHATSARAACRNWRRATGPVPFLLCPHGVPADAPEGAPVTLGSIDRTAQEVRAAVAALRARFGGFVAPGTYAFAGYSLGAKVGVGVVSRLAGDVSLAVFGEGGFDDLTAEVVRGYASTHLQRALLLCRTRACELSFEPAAKRFKASGIDARIVSAETTGHPFEGKVVETARDAWPWLVSDDPRFEGAP